MVAEGGVEVPANTLRAHLREGRNMIGRSRGHGVHTARGFSSTRECIMPCRRTFIMADWIPKPSTCRPAVAYGARLKRVGVPDLLDVLK